MREFTPEELAQYNGENGKPVYIAHAGKVYDVSASKMWKTGTHMKRHRSGQDLTTDIQGAPHPPDVLERYPQVGVLKKADGGRRPAHAGGPGGAAEAFPLLAPPSPSHDGALPHRVHVLHARCSACST
ncbi:MAG: hypothetical protein MZV70_72040 [Desulfobacterales bacterium]|nr:hypothetical protein [Desulfobacterales bacterium]